MIYLYSFFQDSRNPALKLKHSVILEELKKYGSSKPINTGKQSNGILDTEDTKLNSKLQWQYFDEEAYIAKTKIGPGQDAYARNKFNQAASDKLKSNRDIPDTRNPRSVWDLYLGNIMCVCVCEFSQLLANINQFFLRTLWGGLTGTHLHQYANIWFSVVLHSISNSSCRQLLCVLWDLWLKLTAESVPTSETEFTSHQTGNDISSFILLYLAYRCM